MKRTNLCALLGLSFLALACRQDMHDQPRLEPFEASAMFSDGRAMRLSVPGTVARGRLFLDTHMYEGKVDGELATTLPVEISMELLERGRQRFDVFCAPCHDRSGYGEGMIVKRGMKQPPSFHVDRLREAPVGYFFDVITNGFGAMYDLSDRITPEDRWAIIAYIRVLQRSQNTSIDEVAADVRAELEGRP